MKKRIAIRAHGSKDPINGFSGGLGLLQYFHKYTDEIDAEIVLVVSPFVDGSTAKKTESFNIETRNSVSHVTMSSYTADNYKKIAEDYAIDLHFFSGWLKFVRGLPPQHCINIHPGPIQEIIAEDGTKRHFGGKGMRGDHVHKRVWEAYQAGVIHSSALTMHYVTDTFDDARYLIGQLEVPILSSDTHREDYKNRARLLEPAFQQYVCHQLANGAIRIEHDQVVVDDAVEFDGGIFGEFVDLQ